MACATRTAAFLASVRARTNELLLGTLKTKVSPYVPSLSKQDLRNWMLRYIGSTTVINASADICRIC